MTMISKSSPSFETILAQKDEQLSEYIVSKLPYGTNFLVQVDTIMYKFSDARKQKITRRITFTSGTTNSVVIFFHALCAGMDQFSSCDYAQNIEKKRLQKQLINLIKGNYVSGELVSLAYRHAKSVTLNVSQDGNYYDMELSGLSTIIAYAIGTVAKLVSFLIKK
ncbi:MAG: hypothetical protein H0W88_01355 [Parachlamydiaceae bacterium]|nr:hypothetical protein [Parachlamydiaceae bacterium]